MTTISGMTLNEALSACGITSRKEQDVQRRTLYARDGSRIGSFDAFEAWEYLKQFETPVLDHSARCTHPSKRQYAWHAYDGTLVICCCNCGSVLAGAAEEGA